jgi:hypothetical protein
MTKNMFSWEFFKNNVNGRWGNIFLLLFNLKNSDNIIASIERCQTPTSSIGLNDGEGRMKGEG